MIDIKGKLDEAKAKKIRVSPVHTNRASSLGHPCLRNLVYERTRWQDKIPHSIELQYIFDEGNRIENSTIDDLADAGVRVVQQQKDLFWKAYNISGHIDGRIDDPPRQPPIEIKSINPFDFKKITTIADLYNSKKTWLKKIPAQINLYLLLENEEQGYLIFRDKLTAQIKPISVELDYAYAETLIKKAEDVNRHVREGTLPDRAEDEKLHEYCQFYHICLPEHLNPDRLIVDLELESKIDRWFELKEAISILKKEYDPIDDDIKEQLKGKDARIGDWLITGSWVDLKERMVKASRYWRMNVKSLIKVQKIQAED